MAAVADAVNGKSYLAGVGHDYASRLGHMGPAAYHFEATVNHNSGQDIVVLVVHIAQVAGTTLVLNMVVLVADMILAADMRAGDKAHRACVWQLEADIARMSVEHSLADMEVGHKLQIVTHKARCTAESSEADGCTAVVVYSVAAGMPVWLDRRVKQLASAHEAAQALYSDHSVLVTL